jgi:hypothetical protein
MNAKERDTAQLLRRLRDLLLDYGVLTPSQHKEAIGRVESQYGNR